MDTPIRHRLIIAGPTCGKSTLVANIRNTSRRVVIDSDEIIKTLFPEVWAQPASHHGLTSTGDPFGRAVTVAVYDHIRHQLHLAARHRQPVVVFSNAISTMLLPNRTSREFLSLFSTVVVFQRADANDVFRLAQKRTPRFIRGWSASDIRRLPTNVSLLHTAFERAAFDGFTKPILIPSGSYLSDCLTV